MLDLGNLALWEAQDALLAALRTHVESLGVMVDLGEPTNLHPEHVWIVGGAEGEALYEETGNDPSRERFTLRVVTLCTFAADEYTTIRTRFQTILAGITTALSAAEFVGTAVDQARAVRFTIDEGRDGEGHRQLGLILEVECDKWSE